MKKILALLLALTILLAFAAAAAAESSFTPANYERPFEHAVKQDASGAPGQERKRPPAENIVFC